MQQRDDEGLKLIHEHYKDTFDIIREREKQRDFLFYAVIALFGLLFLELQYPSNVQSIFSEITASSAKIDLKALPPVAIMSMTWTLILALTMRYCQVSLHIEKQYNYLHKLEDKMTNIFGDNEVFCREGSHYKSNFPLFRTWAWLFYTLMVPLILLAAITPMLYVEWYAFQTPLYHKVYDTIMATLTFLSIGLYRIAPLIKAVFNTVMLRRRTRIPVRKQTKS